jgi:hypothetical protein
MNCSECKYCRYEGYEAERIYFCVCSDVFQVKIPKTIIGEEASLRKLPGWCPIQVQGDTNGMYSKPKPPIGLMPKQLWVENRLREIAAAIQRYLDEKFEIPVEWVEEYNELSHPR